MRLIFNLLLCLQLSLITYPAHADNCANFTRGVFETFNPKVFTQGKYHRNKSLPWLIKHTGHNPRKMTRSQIIDQTELMVSIPMNLLGEKTATFDDYFLQVQYSYGNVPTPEGAASNNNNIAYISDIKILDFFGKPQMENQKEELMKAFEEIKRNARHLVRKRDPKFVNLKITDELEIPLIPYFRQSTLTDYITFMEKFFFSSNFDILKTTRNRMINFKNKFRKMRGQEPLDQVTRADLSTLTQITTYRQYEIKLKELSKEKWLSILYDRAVYTMIGYVMIPLALGYTFVINFGQNSLKTTIPGIADPDEDEKISSEEVKAILEKKLSEIDINKAFKELLEEDSEFKKAVEQSGTPLDTVFDINAYINEDDGEQVFKIEFKGKTKEGDTLSFKRTLPLNSLLEQ